MATSWWQRALRHVLEPWGGKRRHFDPGALKARKVIPWLESLEDRTLLTGPPISPGVTFTTVETQPSDLLSSMAFMDIPGLKTTVATAGTYHLSASTTFQNTDATAATEVAVRLLVNGEAVDSRVLSFAPNSRTFQQSL